MRLEFCGPPGSGKTTIMTACGRKKPKRLELVPKMNGQFLRFVRKCYADAAIKKTGYLHTQRQYHRALAADRAEDWKWYSELLAQRGLSLALARPGEFKLVERYFELMPPAALTVFVVGPPDVIVERNRLRFLECGQDDRSECVPYLCQITALAMRKLAERGRILALDAEAPVAVNAAKVLEAVGAA